MDNETKMQNNYKSIEVSSNDRFACLACDNNSITKLLLKHPNDICKYREVLRCSICDHSFSLEDDVDVRGIAGGEYGMLQGTPPNARRDKFLAEYLLFSCMINPGDRILDYGAGWGGLIIEVEKISRRYDLGISIVAVEPYLRMREYVSKESAGNIEVVESLDEILTDKADFVICKEVVEHLSEPLVTLKKLQMASKYNASMFLTTPGNPFRNIGRMASYFNYYVPGHVQFFCRKSLKIILKRAGFTSSKFTYIDDFYPELAEERDFDKKIERTFKAIGGRYSSDPSHLQVLCKAK